MHRGLASYHAGYDTACKQRFDKFEHLSPRRQQATTLYSPKDSQKVLKHESVFQQGLRDKGIARACIFRGIPQNTGRINYC